MIFHGELPAFIGGVPSFFGQAKAESRHSHCDGTISPASVSASEAEELDS